MDGVALAPGGSALGAPIWNRGSAPLVKARLLLANLLTTH